MENNHHQENQAKDPHQESDGRNNPAAAERKEHVCSVCGRSFVSGKALGGHVSAHVQAKKAKNNNEEDGEEIIIQESVFCYVCGKKFPSDKSLYGHMRSHPDRPWRGIMEGPPPPPQKAAAAVVDLRRRLKHWGKTDKRSRYNNNNNNVAPLCLLLDAVDKEYYKRIRRKGKLGSKKKPRTSVSENPRFGGGGVERSSSEDTDEYYCKNHMEEIRVHGGIILNPKKIPRKNTDTCSTTSYQKNKESLVDPPEPDPKECKSMHKKLQHKGKIEVHNTIQDPANDDLNNDENQSNRGNGGAKGGPTGLPCRPGRSLESAIKSR